MLNYFFTLNVLVACQESTKHSHSDIENVGSEEDTGTRRILPLGDSITEGVPFTYRYPLHNMLTDENVPFDFIGSHTNGGWEYPEEGWDRDNEGWAGWTTQSIQDELGDWSAQYTVDIALIHLGTNDAGEGNIEDSADAMTAIIEHLRANNRSVDICLAKILPFGSLPEEEQGSTELNAFVDDWNSRLERLAVEMTTPESEIVLVDMHGDFGEDDLDDGIHPTQAGAEKMAERWFECIRGF